MNVLFFYLDSRHKLKRQNARGYLYFVFITNKLYIYNQKAETG